MADSKKSFLIHMDSLEILNELTIEQCGLLLLSMRDYNLGDRVELTGLMKAIFIPFKNQFDRDNAKYEATVERNRVNGATGGRPRKPTGLNENPQEPTGFIGNPTKPSETQRNPKKADNDNDNDNKNDSDNVNDSGNESEPPTVETEDLDETPIEEVEEPRYQYSPAGKSAPRPAPKFEEVCFFFMQNGHSEDFATRFFNRYEAVSWKIGESEITNWRSVANTWFKDPNKYQSQTSPPAKISKAQQNFNNGESAKAKLKKHYEQRNNQT